jgi:TRAP-type C4-dicarboxylate transport system permease small subunit
VSGEGGTIGTTGHEVRHERLTHVPGPLRSVATAALAIACGALVALAAVEAWQVVTRYVLDSPAAWTEPVALLLLKVALMLGAAVGVRQETHFRFALGAAAAGKWRSALEVLGRLATAAIGIVFAAWGTSLMLATWELKTPGAPLPVGLNFAPFVAGGALIALFAFERLRGGSRG